MVQGIAGGAASEGVFAGELAQTEERSLARIFTAALVPAFAGLAVGGLAASQGGYFPTTWGWATLMFLWVAAVAAIVRPSIRLSLWPLALLGSYALLATWIGASALWSPSMTATVPELARVGVYVSGVLALVTIVDRSNYVRLLGGTLAGIAAVCSYSLSTRLFPDRLGVFDSFAAYRVAEPLGYWNALGAFSVFGIALALEFATGSRSLVARSVAATTLVVTLPTLYFTFGRGGWVALIVALVALLALSQARLWTLVASSVVVTPALAATLVASESGALTHRNAALADAVREGRRLALVIVVAAVASALFAALLARAQASIHVPRVVAKVLSATLLAIAILAIGAGIAAAGGPDSVVERAYDEFRAPPPRPVDLNERLLNLSGNGRADLWSIAWRQHRDHAWLGEGAGTYEQYFSARREPGMPKVRDAHGLYVETLGEIGWVGFALLVLALAVPLAAAVFARRSPLVPAAAAAYVAYVVHAGADWDWEMPAVTTAGIFCAMAIAVAAGGRGTFLGGRGRALLAGAAVALALPTAYFLLGESALDEADAARRSGDVAESLAQAGRATRVFPWSGRAWVALAEARLDAGNRTGALLAFRRAAEEDPRDWRSWLGIARTSEGPTRAAALERATQLNPLGLDIAQFRLRLDKGATP